MPSGRLICANGTATAAEQRIGDDVGQNDQHRGNQQRARNVQDSFDLARAVDFRAHGVPQEPGNDQGLGRDRNRRDRIEVIGVLRDAEQRRRDRQQERLQDEQLERGEDLTGRHDAERREQKQRARQCIKSEKYR